MCQLLALNANSPTDISFSFEGFVQRAGLTDTHIDGIGIAYFLGNQVYLYKDHNAGMSSQVRNIVKQYHIKSFNIIAHIRRKSVGEACMSNTHPFIKSLWGENWIFAHNGHIHKIPELDPELIKYHPVGDTDSERFFVYLVNRLSYRFSTNPGNKKIFDYINQIADEFAENGILNFTISNGSFLIIHCSTNLYYITRRFPYKTSTRIDDGHALDLNQFASPNDVATIVATIPITANEQWTQLSNGMSIMFENGEAIDVYHGKESVIDLDLAKKTGSTMQQIEANIQFIENEDKVLDHFLKSNQEDLKESNVSYDLKSN